MGIPIFKKPEDHNVYLNSNNQIIPSVTTLLKIIAKDELMGWANSLGFKRIRIKDELESHAVIGRAAHSLVETYITKGIIDFNALRANKRPAESICIARAFSSFKKYYDDNIIDFKPVFNEKSLSGEKFGGTLDFLTLHKKDLTLCDFKTSSKFYITMFLQLAAYDLLLREIEGKKVKKYMVILLDKKTGKAAQVKVCDDKDEMKMYRECFKKLVDFYYDYYYINQIYWNKELI
jgi:hypothetical protein